MREIPRGKLNFSRSWVRLKLSSESSADGWVLGRCAVGSDRPLGPNACCSQELSFPWQAVYQRLRSRVTCCLFSSDRTGGAADGTAT